MILLIDNSNTRTKFALGDENGLCSVPVSLTTAELRVENLEALFASLEFERAVICSVVPEKAKIIRAALKSCPVHMVSHRSRLSIDIDYPKPAQIGADRLANAVAAEAQFGAPAIVVDFGTAVTFDVVDHEGAYCGGVIAPGVGVLLDYLPKHTALLPKIILSAPQSAIGQTTSEAMNIGAVIGYRGMVREILYAVQAELGDPAPVVATGGDAAMICEGLEGIHEVDPLLTLEGIRQIGLLNPPTSKKGKSGG